MHKKLLIVALASSTLFFSGNLRANAVNVDVTTPENFNNAVINLDVNVNATLKNNVTVTGDIGTPASTTFVFNGNGFALDGNKLNPSDANGQYSGFNLLGGKTLNLHGTILKNFYKNDWGGAILNSATTTISNSTFSSNTANQYGGAIFNDVLSTTTINNSTFSGNTAGNGGAIANNSLSTVTINNSHFSGNSSSVSGGAIANGGTTTINNSTFSGNHSDDIAGAIGNGSTITINNSTFSGNTAVYGGAIFNDVLSIETINNSTFSGNTANLYGGAIYNNGIVTINNSTFYGNTAQGGGAIANVRGIVNINNSTFSRNHAEGLIYNYNGGIVNINNSTFSGNTADIYAGVLFNDIGGIANIYNSTFFSNHTGNNGGAIFNYGAIVNLIADTGNVEFTGNTANDADNAIYLGNTSHLNLNTLNSSKIIFNGGIANDFTNNTININGRNDANQVDDVTIVPNAPTNGEVVLNADMRGFSGDQVNLYGGILTLGPSGRFFNNVDFMASAGTILNLINGKIDTISLNSANINNMNMKIDIDLTALTADNISATNLPVPAKNTINITGIDLINNNNRADGKVTVDPDNKFDITLADSASKISGQVYNYNVANNGNGTLSVTRQDLNPVVFSSSVANQSAVSNLTNIDNIALDRADNVMAIMDSIKTETGVDYDLVNKVAMLGIGKEPKYPTLYGRLEKGSLWFRPFSNLEKIRIDTLLNKVRSTSFGMIAGYDSPLEKLRYGFKGMTSFYGGYSGAYQRYNNINSYQNGGFGGILCALYKHDFYTTLATSVGAYDVLENIKNYGATSYGMIASSVTSKAGYNLHLTRNTILQLNNQTIYSIITSQNYTNAQGARIRTSPLNIIQLVPGVKLSKNIKGWQPYLGVNMVFNPLNSSKVKANDVVLPNSKLGTYIEYGFGIQRLNENETGGFLQAMARNGSRTGVSLQFGLKSPIGKKEPKNRNFITI